MIDSQGLAGNLLTDCASTTLGVEHLVISRLGDPVALVLPLLNVVLIADAVLASSTSLAGTIRPKPKLVLGLGLSACGAGFHLGVETFSLSQLDLPG